ncbi:hypothetical protein NE848_12945 [Gramella jeungdoensis]|uniref:Uncharacterized protein n=1 Tax=Gramella jeungdoensis TaxID=708091 RepID=A0ABT0Z3J8_9FLAO|nr:hypothetical protein [Gramella jeungdoensis]MCM8570292.1 hypothetical protein [Gramella jeungdoensis]
MSNNKVSEFLNLDKRLTELDLKLDADFCILPENIETADKKTDLIFTESTTSVNKYLKQKNVNIEVLTNGSLQLRQRKSIDFYAPLIFVGFTLLQENSNILSVGINVLSDYISDYFKGSFGEKKVKLELIVETKKNEEYKSLNYEGSVEGLKEVPKIVKSMKNE